MRSLVSSTVLFLSVTGCANRDAQPRMIDVGGYRVRSLVEGHGSPAVVFIGGGFGAALETWAGIQPQVAEVTRIVAYDRGGTYKSDPAPMLRASGTPPPFIVVGQSLGGLHARVFAHEYPTDIAGLVLVDPTLEDFDEVIKTNEPVVWREMEEEKARAAKETRTWSTGSRGEFEQLDASFQEARQAWPLPRVYTVVITGTRTDSARGARLATLWLAAQRDLAERLGARHITTDRAGHNVQLDEPELVISAIRDVIAHGSEHAR